MTSTSVVSIVDDDRSVRRALGRVLRGAGYACETFASAREFLDSAPAGRIACLVLDIQLGGMNGFELQRQLVEDRASIPIVFITAYDDAFTREQARRSGAVAYLRKPFDDEALLAAIRGAIGQT